MTIAEAYHSLVDSISDYYGLEEARSIARIVFEDAFQVYNFQKKDELSPKNEGTFLAIQERLKNKEPVQYIFGQADFYGLKFKVNKDTLIPRQETEELVYWVLETIKEERLKQPKVVDIGTGTGCIPITLKAKNKALIAKGLDISIKALIVAKQNAALNRVEVSFEKADILEQNLWPKLGDWDIIISNPPYIPPSEQQLMPKHVLDYEPHIALFVEEEHPLVFYITIADFALQNLEDDGFLFYECNEYNAPKVLEMLQNKGFKNAIIQKDMMGKDRMIRAQKP